MRQHFLNVIDLIKSHTGDFYYEQSFMNYYFNKNLLVDYSIITDDNYNMNIICMLIDKYSKHTNTIIHFAGAHISGENKYDVMYNYVKLYFPFLLDP